VTADAWQPALYGRFAFERRQPFDDLLALCQPVPGGAVVDLGCGDGTLTAELHARLGAGRTVGIDDSRAMLVDAPKDVDGLSFACADLARWSGPPVDLCFSNAALHWVDDHRVLLARLVRGLAQGGQLAFQVPANFAHPSHAVAHEVAAEPRFAALLGGAPPDRGRAVLSPADYAGLLFDLGAHRQSVRLQVYGHVFDSTASVVEWTSGTTLTPYRAALDATTYEAFLARYTERLVEVVGDHRPYFYGFQRILAWARFP
jgi:trans-aconitate 2-methyltransferase